MMKIFRIITLLAAVLVFPMQSKADNHPRVIVTTDGEIDDQASMVRFLLSCNEFDVEGIINSTSQFHWVGGEGFNAFHPVEWVKEFIGYYSYVYDNLKLHDPHYPTPEYLESKWKVGNIGGVGEYKERSEGARLIADVLLDESDDRPVWIQAWGGCNTIASALKIIEEDYPERMESVAKKMRLYLIWEQDGSYQEYIRPHWEELGAMTIIADQFDCMAYIWNKVLPENVKTVFNKEWTTANILQQHGTLCDHYPNRKGAFNAEGDSPAFLHCIDNGLRNMESPAYGGWGGRYVPIRNNVWMDPLPDSTYVRPEGQWGFSESWSKQMEHYKDSTQVAVRTKYFRPMWRWLVDIQNDFAARADWCVKDYASANHHPIVNLTTTNLDIKAKPGEKLFFDASGSSDPDGNKLNFRWWQYPEAGTYPKDLQIEGLESSFTFQIPSDARPSETIHIICEVSDDGSPTLKSYRRLIITTL